MYLKGLVHMKRNNIELAKKFFKQALLIDAKCYEVKEIVYISFFCHPLLFIALCSRIIDISR